MNMTGDNERFTRCVPLLLVLGLGFSLRVYFAFTACFATFDSSTVGLMALHILKGARPLFFYGQNYMGALEAYLAAALFKLWGPSELTLSMSPILFSTAWIAATYLLFKELMGRQAGLVAALCVAVPGWDIMWYSMATYGGYPAAFCLGTLALWLAVRITGRNLSPASYWGHVLTLGATAGVALWTHFISAAYLGTAAILLLAHFIRRRFALRILAPYVVGGVLFTVGILPMLISSSEYDCLQTTEWRLYLPLIVQHAAELFERPLRAHVFSPKDQPLALEIAVLMLLAAIAVLYVLSVRRASKGAERRRLLLPVLFSCVFLTLYLPHFMASFQAPRYTIPLWTMTLSAAFAASVSAPTGWSRRIASVLLGAWLCFCAVCDAVSAHEGMDKKKTMLARRTRIVQKAAGIGAKSVLLVGGEVFGYQGQVLSFHSRDNIKFTSSYTERCYASAMAVEADPGKVLACESVGLPALKAALQELGVDYKLVDDKRITLAYDLKVRPVSRKPVPLGEIKVETCGIVSGAVENVTDRTVETFMSGKFDGNNGFTMDFGKERKITGLALFAPKPRGGELPSGYAILTSHDGTNFSLHHNVEHRYSPSWVNGNEAYFKSRFGTLECRFKPVSTRHLRFVVRKGQRRETEWQISEIFVFEDKDGPGSSVPDAEVKDIASALLKNNVRFTIADRWLSAQLLPLLEVGATDPPVYLNYAAHLRNTGTSRIFVPQKGRAVVVSQEYAEDCERILGEVCGPSAVWTRMDYDHYVLLMFEQVSSVGKTTISLFWNGNTLLKTDSSSSYMSF